MSEIENDRIIDRSPKQKEIRLASLKTELGLMGYSVVRTSWLNALMDMAKLADRAISMEPAE